MDAYSPVFRGLKQARQVRLLTTTCRSDRRNVLTLSAVACPPLEIPVLAAINQLLRQRPLPGREVGSIPSFFECIFLLVFLVFPFVRHFVSGLVSTSL